VRPARSGVLTGKDLQLARYRQGLGGEQGAAEPQPERLAPGSLEEQHRYIRLLNEARARGVAFQYVPVAPTPPRPRHTHRKRSDEQRRSSQTEESPDTSAGPRQEQDRAPSPLREPRSETPRTEERLPQVQTLGPPADLERAQEEFRGATSLGASPRDDSESAGSQGEPEQSPREHRHHHRRRHRHHHHE